VLGLLLAVPALAQGAKDVCGDRPHCIVKRTQRAPKGHEVVELSLGKKSEEDEGSKCEQKEWWLRRPDKSVVKLLDSCPEDRGIGEDAVTVEKNRFIHVVTGGARSRWEIEKALQLVPLTWASDEQVSYDALDTDKMTRERFNYTTFEGRWTRGSDGCGDVTAQLIPAVEVPADFLSEGWKRMSLGRCSVDGSFALLGKAQGKEDARIRAVLAQGNVLLVEVVDDTWTGPGAKWLTDDHVELWLTGSDPASFNTCEDEEEQTGLLQWGIRIADGKVFPAYGDPKEPLPVEVMREGKVAHLKIQLPKVAIGLTVIYSDSDAGKKQELMVGTSALKFGRAGTLSPVWRIIPARATCEVKENQLVPVLTELHPKPGEAVLSE